jgi:hypothetical protein
MKPVNRSVHLIHAGRTIPAERGRKYVNRFPRNSACIAVYANRKKIGAVNTAHNISPAVLLILAMAVKYV